MRELTLGLVKVGELARVAWKEAVVGVINGCVLGVLLGLITFSMACVAAAALPRGHLRHV